MMLQYGKQQESDTHPLWTLCSKAFLSLIKFNWRDKNLPKTHAEIIAFIAREQQKATSTCRVNVHFAACIVNLLVRQTSNLRIINLLQLRQIKKKHAMLSAIHFSVAGSVHESGGPAGGK
jgi:hypothetical protein